MKHRSNPSISILVVVLALGAGSARAEDPETGFRIGTRGIEWISADENVALRLGGRLHADAYIYQDDVTPMENDVELRRLRFYLSGALFQDWRFKVEGDVTPKRNGWRNVWGSYRGFEKWDIRGGNYIPPTSFEALLSSNDLTFMERSLASALTPGFLLGGSVSRWSRHWSVAVGGFANPLGGDNIEQRQSDGVSFAGRFTVAPWRKKRRLLHLGFGTEYRSVDSGSGFRLRWRPESGGAPRLVDTGDLVNVDDSLMVGFEAAAVLGPVSILGQYQRNYLWRSALADVSFQGGFAEVSWLVTGESKRYSSRRAVFRRVEPKRGWGAVELATRYSGVDLTDEDVIGGREQNLTLGANWYITQNFRAMFNFIQVFAKRSGDLVQDRPRTYQFRLQAAF